MYVEVLVVNQRKQEHSEILLGIACGIAVVCYDILDRTGL